MTREFKMMMLILFMSVIPMISGNFVKDTIKSIQRVHPGEYSCNVQMKNRKLHGCTVKPLSGRVIEGAVCTYIANRGSVEHFLCDQGIFIYGGEGAKSNHKRKKRCWVCDTVSHVAETVQDTADQVGDAVQDAAEQVGDAVQDTADQVGDAVQDTADQVGDAVQDTADQVGDAVQDTAEQVGDALQDAADNVGDAVQDVADQVGGAVQDAADSVGDAVQDVFDNAEDFVNDVGDAIKDPMRHLGETVEDILRDPYNPLIPIAVQIEFPARLLGYECVIVCKQSEPKTEYIIVPQNFPPTILCPRDISITANKHQDKVRVNWTEPFAYDPEDRLKDDGVKLIAGKPSGSFFEAGNHTIMYKATDEQGFNDTCSFVITIKVIRCTIDDRFYSNNKRTNCSERDVLYGDACQLSCDVGYEISGNTTAICEKDGSEGRWTHIDSTCRKKQCSPPEQICNGKFECTNDNFFESVCYPRCNRGYSTDGRIECDGDAWEVKKPLLPCTDDESPSLTCPPDIHVFAEVSGTVAVHWETPIATDNSAYDNCTEYKVTITQTSGQSSGSEFGVGIYTIEYKATDMTGNSENCSFDVTVQKLRCGLLENTDKMFYNCSDKDNSLGSVCTFECPMGSELVGSPYATCVKDPVNGNRAFWDWSNGNQTFCEYLTCPELPAPAGGALACSTFLSNTICTMSCSKEHSVALGTPIQYFCNKDQVWSPGIPPNCTDRVHPLAKLSGEFFYYYDGDCSDPTVQEGIKDNFVKEMNKLDTEGMSDICPNLCTVDGVTVTCGPLNGRKRKRSLFHHLKKRATHEIKISFSIEAEWQTNKDIWGNEDGMQLVASFIQNRATNGTFDVPGMVTGNMNFGYIEMICPTGLVPNYGGDGACDGCPPGKYLEDNTCHECQKGTYQDMEFQTNCTSCPDGTSTEVAGSTSSTQCKDKCPPGTYSTTGVVPCTQCPMGQYQNKFGATSCLTCGPSKYTTLVGSTKETDCQVLDVAFAMKHSTVTLGPLDNAIDSFTMAFWMKCANSSNHDLTASFGNLNFTVGKEISYTVTSKRFAVKNIYDLTKWTHVAMASDINAKSVQMHVSGVQLTSFDLRDIATEEMKVDVGSRLKIQSETIGCILSQFNMVGNALTHNAVKSQSGVCQSLMTGAIYNIDSFYNAASTGIQFPVTTCDAIDECLSNPCKAGNICINKLGGYTCKCKRGYSGSNCQIPPDFCINHGCHGESTCVSNFNDYTCTCLADFTGIYCDKRIAHGNWGNWYDTSECSASCNGGVKTRERFCNNPEPDNNGRYCEGSNVSTIACNEQECPVCDPWYTIRAFKNVFNCTTSGDVISCTVTCESGYTFVKDKYPLGFYQCGPKTSYQWHAKPPGCARIDSPRAISTISSVKYEVDCSSQESFVSQLYTRLNRLRCVENNTCGIQTTVSGCPEYGIEKRSLSSLQVTINLLSNLTSTGDLQLEDFYDSNIVSPSLLEMVQIYSDMDQTIYQMKSTSVLTIDDNGIIYEADLSTFNFTTNVTCREGTVNEDYLCVDCPTGTHWKDGLCILCPEGTYQNQGGQLECKQCPTGFTTDYIASQSVEDCNVRDEANDSPPKIEKFDDGNDKKVIIIVAVVTSVVVVAIVIGIFIMKRRCDKIKSKTLDKTKSANSTDKSYPEMLDDKELSPVYVGIPPLSTKPSP